MQIVVNGFLHTLSQGLSLAEALEVWGYKNDMPFAVAVNNQVIPRQGHAEYILEQGNIIEILMPMQGG